VAAIDKVSQSHYKNHESVRKMAELTIVQPCTLLGPIWTKLSNTVHKSTQLCQMFVLHFTQYLTFKVAFAMFPVEA
jgi:hypothetical protein